MPDAKRGSGGRLEKIQVGLSRTEIKNRKNAYEKYRRRSLNEDYLKKVKK